MPFLPAPRAGTNTCAYVTAANKANPAYLGRPAASNCAGDVNQVSFAVDYPLTKHFNLYSGISYSQVSGGLSSRNLHGDMLLFASGVRLSF